jgi:hypothetical protein
MGKKGEYTGELMVSRKSESKTLAKSSIMLAFHRVLLSLSFRTEENIYNVDNSDNAENIENVDNADNTDMIRHEYRGPKAIGQIFGISYVYSMFWRWGLIAVPEKVEKKLMSGDAY